MSSESLIVEDHDACEMQAGESSEGDDCIERIQEPRNSIHRGKQSTQFRLARRNDRGQNHEAGLGRHCSLIKDLITGRLVVGCCVHSLPQGCQREVHAAARSILVAQGAMFLQDSAKDCRKAA